MTARASREVTRRPACPGRKGGALIARLEVPGPMSCREGEKWLILGDAGVSKADSGSGMGMGMGELRQTASSVAGALAGPRVRPIFLRFLPLAARLPDRDGILNQLHSSEVQQPSPPPKSSVPRHVPACRDGHRASVARGAAFSRRVPQSGGPGSELIPAQSQNSEC